MSDSQGKALRIDNLEIDPEKHFALVVSGTDGKAVLKIWADGRLWVDPDKADEAAKQLLWFYGQLRFTKLHELQEAILRLSLHLEGLHIPEAELDNRMQEVSRIINALMAK